MKTLVLPRCTLPMSCLLVAALAGLGCGAAPTDHEGEPSSREATATVEQAFTNGWYSYRINGTQEFNTGLLLSQWTCFLSGVWGDLANPSPQITSVSAGAFHLIQSGGVFTWGIANASYTVSNAITIGSQIMCVPSAQNQTTVQHFQTFGWGSGGPQPTYLGAVTANRICGLTAVVNQEYTTANNLWQTSGTNGGSTGDSVYVYNDGVNWYLTGSGNAEGYAVCVDRTPNSGLWGWEIGGWNTWNLLQENINTTQCFLSGVGGRFQDPSSYSDGIGVNYNSSTNWWSVTTTNGQTSWVNCIQ